MIQSLNMALSHPTPYSASGCHHMSQRANACHCPEVTRELNCFSCTTSPRTKPGDPAVSSSSDVHAQRLERGCRRAIAYRRLRGSAELPEPSGCSGCWTTGLHSGIPTSSARSTGVQEAQQGTTTVPKRTERPQPHRLGATELWLCLAFRFGLLWLQMGLGFERSLSPALRAETSSKSTEAMHAAASENEGTVC